MYIVLPDYIGNSDIENIKMYIDSVELHLTEEASKKIGMRYDTINLSVPITVITTDTVDRANSILDGLTYKQLNMHTPDTIIINTSMNDGEVEGEWMISNPADNYLVNVVGNNYASDTQFRINAIYELLRYGYEIVSYVQEKDNVWVQVFKKSQ